MPADRVFIIGGPGSGKSTLANRLGAALDVPVHHLDDLDREGGGRGPERSDSERAADVAAIVDSTRWIAEGVQLGWTTPLLEKAETIVWLDHVRWQASSGRIVRRFVGQALAEARQRRGRERFLRFRDYGRKLRELAASVPETRTYPRTDLEATLRPFDRKVVHCTTSADVAAAVDRLVEE